MIIHNNYHIFLTINMNKYIWNIKKDYKYDCKLLKTNITMKIIHYEHEESINFKVVCNLLHLHTK